MCFPSLFKIQIFDKIHSKTIVGSKNVDVKYRGKSLKTRSLKRKAGDVSKVVCPEVFDKTSPIDKAKVSGTGSIYRTYLIK